MTNVYINAKELNTWISKYFDKDLISVDDLIRCIEELDAEVGRLKEKIEDREQDIQDNYKQVPPSSQYGVKDD